MFDKNKTQNQVTEASIPVTKVRAALTRIVKDGNYLRNQGGGWLFNERTPFTGLNLHASYASEDQAIDTLMGIYFPESVRVAA